MQNSAFDDLCRREAALSCYCLVSAFLTAKASGQERTPIGLAERKSPGRLGAHRALRGVVRAMCRSACCITPDGMAELSCSALPARAP